MDLIPSRSFHKQKMSFLSELWPPTLQHSILGQYDGYQSHLAPEGGKSSVTPTYASVVLYSQDLKWEGVPFLLTAGKQLDERKAFARVVFKKWQFSLVDDKTTSCPVEMVFLIQDEELNQPGILLSSHFFKMGLEVEGSLSEVEVNGCSYSFVTPANRISANAYIALVGDVLNGWKENFVNTDSLIASWEVWDPLLEEIESSNGSLDLISYSPQDLTVLDFNIEYSQLKANASILKDVCTAAVILPGSGIPALVGSKNTISSCLAKEMYKSASAAVADSGMFHLALPGGRSPRLLFKYLSLEYAEIFPWRHTHIWQTDERCVLHNHTESNWNQIDRLLLSQVSIPYHQLHPMPLALQNGVCVPEDDGCGLYEQPLQETRLDHVVVGVGSDGHIASLFPQVVHLTDSSHWVWLVRLPSTATVATKERMTLSYEALLSARAISVVVMGEGKEGIAKRLMTGEGGMEGTPMLKLVEEGALGRDRITFYIAT
jgi:6-phosphogluconolactonase